VTTDIPFSGDEVETPMGASATFPTNAFPPNVC
jgi:hypothetical protein